VANPNIGAKLRERLLAPVYSIADAAKYADAHPNTVAYWHRGGDPILDRGSDKSGTPLSYLELAEVAFVAVMRARGITMPRIRSAREYLHDKLGSPYPFASVKFKTEGIHILLNLRDFSPNADENDVIIADQGGQTAWGEMLSKKFHEFDYVHDLAMRWFPQGRSSPVFIDPRIAFGEPNVKGVPTKSLRGRAIAGDSFNSIKADFRLTIPEIRAALQFEGVDASDVAMH
jgi:uncharacterized protein (DUF433 family)